MKSIRSVITTLVFISLSLSSYADESMDKMWGDRSTKEGVEGSKRA